MKSIYGSMIILWACGAISAQADDHYAAQNGQTPASPYTSWTSAANSIQAAIDAASADDTVWVGAGRYTVPPNPTNFAGTNVVFINMPLILRSSNGVPEDTIIDGQGTHRGIGINYSQLGQNFINGFTITNCHGVSMGGGILITDTIRSYYALGWTNWVQNCRIVNNRVTSGTNFGYKGWGADGGGIGIFTRSATGLIVSNCVLRYNLATNELAPSYETEGVGGGIYQGTYQGIISVISCLIQNNAAYKGGGACLGGGTARIENSEISDCKVAGPGGQSFGGGFYLTGHAIFKNCLMCGNNTVNGRGSAINYEGRWSNTVFQLYNCTIVSNMSGYGLSMRSWAEAQTFNPALLMYNCIIYSNANDIYMPPPVYNYTNQAFNCCFYKISGDVFGTGNITSCPPDFVDFNSQNFRLKNTSPCLNTGSNLDWMTDAVDLDGMKRVRYGIVDMGAYEYIHDATIYMFH